MPTDSTKTGTPPRGLFLIDLALVVTVVLLFVGPLHFQLLDETPLEVGIGLIFVLYIPGYALVSVLFPSATPRESDQESNLLPLVNIHFRPVTGVERALLSLGLSLALVPLTGVALSYVATPVSPSSLLHALAGLTVGLTGIAAYRRFRLPADRRYTTNPFGLLSVGKTWLLDTDDATERALNIFLVAGLVLAMSGIVYAVAAPKQGETYTEFYLLSEDPQTGELTAESYPTSVGNETRTSVHVGVENREQQTTTYTVIVELQRFQNRTGQSVLVQKTELGRTQTTLTHNETYLQEHAIKPTFVGESLRLTFMLYRGMPPEEPTIRSAYRHLHVWIDVET